MEVSETTTGQNVQKSSSSTSETVNETVVNTEVTKVINGDSEKTVTVSATIAVAPAKNEKNDEDNEIEEIVEVIEVTDDESGEEVTEEIIVTTTTKKPSETPTVTKVPSIDASAEKKVVKNQKSIEKQVTIEEEIKMSFPTKAAVKKQVTIERQATIDPEDSTSAEEVEEVEYEEDDEVSKLKSYVATTVEATETPQHAIVVESKEEENDENCETPQHAIVIETKQEEITDSLAQLKLSEFNEKPQATDSKEITTTSESIRCDSAAEIQAARRASAVNEGVQRPIQHAVSIAQTAPIQQTAPFQQTTLIQQSTPPVQSSAPTNYIQPGQQSTPYVQQQKLATYAQPTPVTYQQQTPKTHQIPQENIRNQLQEIVSDIDRVVEEHKLFSDMPQKSAYQPIVTSQNYAQTEKWKQTSNGGIFQKPNYFYQEDSSIKTSSAKPIDLQKIFTPATDAEVIVPNKNRKNENLNGYGDYQIPSNQYSEEKSYSTKRYESKIPLKLVMDPRGVVQDIQTQGITFDQNSGMLSPDKCAELISALHTDTPKGKGAELFAKRRKRSEKWIVDETTRSANNPAATSYSAGPTQIYDTNQYNQNSYQSVDVQVNNQQASWENQQRQNDYNIYSSSPSAYKSSYQPTTPATGPSSLPSQQYKLPQQQTLLKRTPNNLRDLAYKPSIPQGWNAPPTKLPNEMFTPPEIPLSGYTPPRTDAYFPKTSSSSYSHQFENTYAPPPISSTDFYQSPNEASNRAPPSFRKIDPSKVYGAQFPVQNFTPKPFTPSPIAQEKLAIFEQPQQLQQPIIRRPLTVPNQRVRNVSPIPFGGGSQYSSYQNEKWSVMQSSSPNYSAGQCNVPIASQTSPRASAYDWASHQENFNRAARGWGQNKGFYQPISFSKPFDAPYTDF